MEPAVRPVDLEAIRLIGGVAVQLKTMSHAYTCGCKDTASTCETAGRQSPVPEENGRLADVRNRDRNAAGNQTGADHALRREGGNGNKRGPLGGLLSNRKLPGLDF